MESLRKGIEGRDATLLASLYADDAELRMVDRNHPTSSPIVLRGKEAIAEMFKDICGRDMAHEIGTSLSDGDRLAFTDTCTYPDGTKVISMAMIETRDGKIVRETELQEWGM